MMRPSRRVLAASALAFAASGPAQVVAAEVAASQLPTGGSFKTGAGRISSAGASMRIDQATANAIVHWDSFSIGRDGIVSFRNGAGATLNRVTGGQLSAILGRLSATGNLYLVNPNEIVIGSSGQVITGGDFVASTLDIPDAQFLSGGAMAFSGDSAAEVKNLGRIRSETGDVFLIAQTVRNAGGIHAPQGSVGLAAGGEVTLLPEGGVGRVRVRIRESESAPALVTNEGLIAAAEAELRAAGGNVYALAGNSDGIVRATGVEQRGGRIVLRAAAGAVAADGTLEVRTGAGDGGEIEVAGDLVEIGGRVDASGAAGGAIEIAAGSLALTGEVAVLSTAGPGGRIALDVRGASRETASARVDASGATDGGTIRHVAGGAITSSAQYAAARST